MPSLDEELKLTFQQRLFALAEHVDGLLGGLEPSKVGLRTALGLVSQYPDAARRAFDAQWDVDPAGRSAAARVHLAHLQHVATIVEEWFARGAGAGVPRLLLRAVDDEFAALRSPRRAVVAIGSPRNFETYIPDLWESLFEALGERAEAPERDHPPFAMIQVPRLEGGQAMWWPLVIGHEVAHLALIDKPQPMAQVDLTSDLSEQNFSIPKGSSPLHDPLPEVLVPQRWLEELLCDAYAVRRFGPAAVAAMGTFLEAAGSFDQEDHALFEHPPPVMRLQLMLDWVGDVRSPALRAVLHPWRERVDGATEAVPNWAAKLSRILAGRSDDIFGAISRWPARYRAADRTRQTDLVAARLMQRLPSDRDVTTARRVHNLAAADIINAAWVCAHDLDRSALTRLTTKSLESIEFLRLWDQAEQTVGPEHQHEDGAPEELNELVRAAGVEYGGVIPAQEVRERLKIGAGGHIAVSPPPAKLAGSAMDVRLSNKFIVFEPSATVSFDPVAQHSDARTLQGYVEKDWGDVFVLHPGELVLASVFEFIALPADVSCLVVTRSSYGRLGLVTATAVLVHPYYRGCLTLELVNLGQVPLTLTPGERIGQLVFLRVHEPADPPEEAQKYVGPIGPEFSKINQDRDAQVLSELRRVRARRTGTQDRR